MKKELLIVLVTLVTVLGCGCSNQNQIQKEEQPSVNEEQTKDDVELLPVEEATLAACQYVLKGLGSGESFELTSANVIDDVNGDSKYYLVKMEYTITDVSGATDLSSFQTIDSAFQNRWYSLKQMGQTQEDPLQCESFKHLYEESTTTPVSVDCERINQCLIEE